MISVSAAVAVRSGKAQVDWLSATTAYEVGKPVQTAVRLLVDEHWHTYWINPGDGGMKFSATWELPAGWTASELKHPLPKRFMTGELAGFGYEGTVIFPVSFTPPAGFTGAATLKGKVSWLTCNEDSCIPGNAQLELTFQAGILANTATAEAKWIEQATIQVPIAAPPETTLTVTEKPKFLQLSIEGFQPDADHLETLEVFPATAEVIESNAKFQWTKNGKSWIAEVPKSPYLTAPLSELTLVLADKTLPRPVSLTWKTK